MNNFNFFGFFKNRYVFPKFQLPGNIGANVRKKWEISESTETA